MRIESQEINYHINNEFFHLNISSLESGKRGKFTRKFSGQLPRTEANPSWSSPPPTFLRANIRPLNIKATWTNIKLPKLVRGGMQEDGGEGGGYFKGCRVGLTNAGQFVCTRRASYRWFDVTSCKLDVICTYSYFLIKPFLQPVPRRGKYLSNVT